MKIAVFFELDGGGARRGANEFAKALVLQGHTVDLFCIDRNIREDEKEYYSHVYLYKFDPVVWKGNDWKARLKRDTLELFSLFLLHRKIALRIKKAKYEFIFAQPSKFTQAPFILSLSNVPTLYYCQEPLRLVYDPLFSIPADLAFPKKIYEKAVRFFRKKIDAFNIHNAAIVLANSTYTKTKIADAYERKSTVCHMGVDTKRFFPVGRKTTDILFIGSKDWFDGYPLFEESISLMKKAPKVHYLIRDENWATNDAELRRFYSEARIVICFGFHEPFGLIPLEAMACGSTVVALDEGGYKDSVEPNKTGILVPRDPKIIASVLSGLLRNEAKMLRLQKAALVKIKHYWAWEKGASQIVALYENYKKNMLYRKREQKAVSSWFILYIAAVSSLLLIFRIGFRVVRSHFIAPPIVRGIVGYAQYEGYPLSFETYYFGFMFLLPILIALCVGLLYRKRRV
jgi:glycosyltransferase involved in cell wall biosynthesis